MTRRLALFALLLALGVAVFAYASTRRTPNTSSTGANPAVEVISHNGAQTLDEVVYEETWETGLNGWTAVDLTNMPGTWHLDTRGAFGAAGTSWWVGDPALGDTGGYDNAWYMTLDSPPIVLPNLSPAIRFVHRYSVEPPAGAEAPYNGWDGVNIRVSTNNGTSWTTVPQTALQAPYGPVYEKTSLYSFGFQHCEGANVPGWCGNTATTRTWHVQAANLSTWAGQTVKIRFAFASDPAFSSTESSPNGDPGMFGWQVDNIRVYAHGGTDTVFTDDCNSATGWVSGIGRANQGAPWRIMTDDTPENGTHCVIMNDAASGEYHPNMKTALVSPFIDLRSLEFGTLIPDIQMQGDLYCVDLENAPEDCDDGWKMEVSADSGRTWCNLEFPDCDSSGHRYVGPIETWELFSEGFSQVPWTNLYELAHSHVLQFRILVETGCNNLVAEGMKFDNFTLTHQVGFTNDVSCYSLQVRYPNVAGRPFKIRGYFSNPGQEAQNNVQGFWRINTGTFRPFLGFMSLDPAATARRDTNITIATAGVNSMFARAAISNDEYRGNDTARVVGIDVRSAADPLEIGYDIHGFLDSIFYFNGFATGQGAVVHFTPVADAVLRAPTFNLNGLKVQFSDEQTGSQQIRVHVYLGATLGQNEIYNELVTVTEAQTGNDIWKTIDVSNDPDTRALTQDFWVWFETVATGPTPHYPAVLGVRAQPWDDIHHYFWSGSGNAQTLDYFFQIHALLEEPMSVREIGNGAIPANWSLSQNFPNPFNPTTEIHYTVPRAEHVTLKVYNLMGQEVATLVDQMSTPGTFSVSFSGLDLASGVYVYRLESASFSATHKMLLMK